jgi:hypothetical protein
MADQDWGKGPLFEPPVVRVEAEHLLKVERPAEVEVRQVMAPPAPAQAAAQLQALQDGVQAAPEGARSEKPPDETQTMVQLGLALYLLQAVHFDGKAGYEHLIREDRTPRRDDDDGEQDDA